MKPTAFRRVVLVVVFYLAYRYFNSGANIPTDQPANFEYSNLVPPESPAPEGSIIFAPFSFAWGVISWCFSTMWWLLSIAWTIIAFLMSFFSYIWAIVTLIINVFFMLVMYNSYKHRAARTVAKFFQAAFVFLLIPLVFNGLFSYKEFAFNLFLPLYLALFVDILGDSNLLTGRSIRNFVFFAVMCAFL